VRRPEPVLDPRLVHAVHVQGLRHAQLGGGREPHVLLQVSTIEALLAGTYDGDVTVGELAARGDIGLGTFNALDGELVLVDGVVYRAAEDGTAAPAEPDRRCPFAVVTPFAPERAVRVTEPEADEPLLARVVPDARRCAAVRIDGRFLSLRLRSVPAQRPPYPPLVDVLGHQRTWDERDVEGTVVGFSFPAHAGGLNLPGHHLHFISADRRRGGHVLACRLADGRVEVDREAEVRVELPPGVELPGGAGDDPGDLARLEHQ
jgi:acetolactate decarboxylase